MEAIGNKMNVNPTHQKNAFAFPSKYKKTSKDKKSKKATPKKKIKSKKEINYNSSTWFNHDKVSTMFMKDKSERYFDKSKNKAKTKNPDDEWDSNIEEDRYGIDSMDYFYSNREKKKQRKNKLTAGGNGPMNDNITWVKEKKQKRKIRDCNRILRYQGEDNEY